MPGQVGQAASAPAAAAGVRIIKVGPRLAIAGVPLVPAAAGMLYEALTEGDPTRISYRQGVPREEVEYARTLFHTLHPLVKSGWRVWILAYPSRFYVAGWETPDPATLEVVNGFWTEAINENIAIIGTARCYSRRVGCFSSYAIVLYDPDNDEYYTYVVSREPRDEKDVLALLGGPRVAAALRRGLEVKRQGDIFFIRRNKCRGKTKAKEAVIFNSHKIQGEIYSTIEIEEQGRGVRIIHYNDKRVYVRDGVATHPQHPLVELPGCWEIAWNTRRVNADIRFEDDRLTVEAWDSMD